MEHIYKLLSEEISRLEAEISNCSELEEKAGLIGNKNLVEHSIKLLKKCEKFGVSSGSIFTKLPNQVCESPSSEYRVIEDNETDDPKYWREIEIESKQNNCVRLCPGDIVIEV